MADKSEAQRDVEYFNELIANETDENRRIVLQRLLADAEKLLHEEVQEERKTKGSTKEDHIKGT
jgi:hypothetical protein